MTDSPFTLTVMPHTYRCGAFDCGVPSINAALQGQLLTSIREKRSRAYYMEDAQGCVGFIALRAESFEVADSIDREQYAVSARTVPGVLLELIAVDNRMQRSGLGKQLLLAAVALAGQVSEVVGARFLVLDSLPERVDFYGKNKFRRTVKQPDEATVFMILDLM